MNLERVLLALDVVLGTLGLVASPDSLKSVGSVTCFRCNLNISRALLHATAFTEYEFNNHCVVNMLIPVEMGLGEIPRDVLIGVGRPGELGLPISTQSVQLQHGHVSNQEKLSAGTEDVLSKIIIHL